MDGARPELTGPPPRQGRDPDEQKIADAVPRIEREIEVLEARLAESGFLAGDSVSIADFFLVPMLAYFRNVPEGERLLVGRAGIARWWEAMSARPSFAATQPPQG